MAFVKGMPRHPASGRKKGSKNKRTVAKVSEILAENGINPVIQILKILRPGADGSFFIAAADRAKLWLQLQSYCEAKPKPLESLDDGLDLDEFEHVSNEDLLKIIKKPGSS